MRREELMLAVQSSCVFKCIDLVQVLLQDECTLCIFVFEDFGSYFADVIIVMYY